MEKVVEGSSSAAPRLGTGWGFILIIFHALEPREPSLHLLGGRWGDRPGGWGICARGLSEVLLCAIGTFGTYKVAFTLDTVYGRGTRTVYRPVWSYAKMPSLLPDPHPLCTIMRVCTYGSVHVLLYMEVDCRWIDSGRA